MFHIQAKQHENPPSFLTVKIAPIDNIPESSWIRDCGVDTLALRASSDFHFEESHKIEAVTVVKVVWFEGPLQGQKRKDHLHL